MAKNEKMIELGEEVLESVTGGRETHNIRYTTLLCRDCNTIFDAKNGMSCTRCGSSNVEWHFPNWQHTPVDLPTRDEFRPSTPRSRPPPDLI